MMANSSSALQSIANLSGQNLNLLRWTLCEQQQQHPPLLDMQTSSVDLLLARANYMQSQSASSYIINSQLYQTSADLIPNEHPVTKFVIRYMLQPTSTLESTLDYYSSVFWQNSGDKRTSSLPFMSGGPWKLLYATMIYLYLIKILLPRAMKTIPALDLNWPIRSYNLLMIASNIYAFYHGCRLLDYGRKCFGCEVINHEDYSHAEIELLNYGWLFLLSRLVEWLDTIFFVLRKKDNQVTKLHVFHHSFVPVISWIYLKYHPGKTMAFFPLVNTFVHSIMYTYYFLATFGSSVQPYLWWKKYLTSLQIVQFVLIIIQLATIPLSTNERCQYPRGFLYFAFAGAILFLWLFYTYYIETYKKSAPKREEAKSQVKNLGRSSGDRQVIKEGPSSHMMRKPKMDDREGSSRALSDVIENAINPECDRYGRTLKLD